MKTRNAYLYVLGALFCIGFFVILGLSIMRPFPAENQSVLNILLGILSSGVMLILGYFFGSSKGSADKTDIMAKNGEK